MLKKAITLTSNGRDDLQNIKELGEGWLAEETLAIAIYCALKYQNDFSKGIIAAVNHSGDSDSTGAVAGNILGAWLSVDAIESKWTDDLELLDIICEIADDMCNPLAEEDPFRKSKYLYGSRYQRPATSESIWDITILDKAERYIEKTKSIKISDLQKKLKIDYGQAVDVFDWLIKDGMIDERGHRR